MSSSKLPFTISILVNRHRNRSRPPLITLIVTKAEPNLFESWIRSQIRIRNPHLYQIIES